MSSVVLMSLICGTVAWSPLVGVEMEIFGDGAVCKNFVFMDTFRRVTCLEYTVVIQRRLCVSEYVVNLCGMQV